LFVFQSLGIPGTRTKTYLEKYSVERRQILFTIAQLPSPGGAVEDLEGREIVEAALRAAAVRNCQSSG
jgi:hypothetical protein